jgi:hypothetical protein
MGGAITGGPLKIGGLFEKLCVLIIFITLASVCSIVINIYLGLSNEPVWFIFGGAFIESLRRLKL